MTTNRLRSKTALVTGASSGIGEAIALRLAVEGVNLCLVGRNEARLSAVRERARRFSGVVEYLAIDLTDLHSVGRITNVIENQFKPLDMIVHSAGAISLNKVEDAGDDEFMCQLTSNVIAPYVLTRSLLPLLNTSDAQVVFINSSIVFNPRPGTLQFAASQHALKAVADTLRAEVNERGIRVLSMFPGRTATPRQEDLHKIEGKPYRPERLLQSEDVAEIVVCAMSLGPSAEVVDIHIRPRVKNVG